MATERGVIEASAVFVTWTLFFSNSAPSAVKSFWTATSLLRSLVSPLAQHHRRIDPRRTTRGQPSRQQADRAEHHGGGDERRWIPWLEAVEERRDEARRPQAQRGAGGDADDDQRGDAPTTRDARRRQGLRRAPCGSRFPFAACSRHTTSRRRGRARRAAARGRRRTSRGARRAAPGSASRRPGRRAGGRSAPRAGRHAPARR